jgi:hypothetical protein
MATSSMHDSAACEDGGLAACKGSSMHLLKHQLTAC